MAVTTRSDLIIPEILADAVRAAWPDRVAFKGTPAVAESPTLPGGVRGGDTVKVPYFNAIGEFDDVAEGVPLTPVNITMTAETATVRRAGKAVEMTTWAELSAKYADPYAELARQLVEGATRKFDAALIAVANATGSGQATVDRSTGTITYDAIVDALNAFGDAQVDVAAVVVHSKVLGDLRKVKDANGLPLFVDAQQGGLPKVLGLPLIVSDRAPVITGTPTKYVTLFVLRGGLALWYNGEPKIETDRDILADTDVLAVNIYYVAHRYSRMPEHTKPPVVRLITQ
jgi:HK97 family phage major capsid protein